VLHAPALGQRRREGFTSDNQRQRRQQQLASAIMLSLGIAWLQRRAASFAGRLRRIGRGTSIAAGVP